MDVGSVIVIIGSVLLALLKFWQENAPARKVEAINEANQAGRTALVSGDAAAVTERIDRVLDDQARSSGGNAGGSGATDQERESGIVRRLADFGIRISSDTGAG